MCGDPSTVTHLGHIVVVLRRSPAPVTSSSPSPRHPADITLPRPQLDQELEGRHRAERVLNAEVPYVRHSVIGYLDHGEYDSVIHVHWNASARDLQGYVDALLFPSLLEYSID